MKEIPLTRGYVARVDDADYEFLMQWQWSAVGRKPVYAVRGYRIGGKTCPVRMHRQILGIPSAWIVDHINRDSLDNRKVNLRLATPDQNAQNRSRSNKQGYRGVHPEGKKYRVMIQSAGKRRNLGLYGDAIVAAKAYDAAAVALHGAYAVLNFP